MGKSVGIEFLQNDITQIGIAMAAVIMAILDRKKFVESPGIVLTTYNDSPFDALERDLVKFSYKEPLFAYVVPVIILSLFNLTVGFMGLNIGIDEELSHWLFFAAASGLIGNALPGSINTFSGNLGEVGMQYGLLQAARIVYRYYENSFHVLNFGFYFFLISGFALWADRFKSIPIMDLVFGIILAAATCLYPYGNAVDVGLPERVPDFLIGFLEGVGPVSKIPLYAGMTATFLEITRRGKEIFGKQMYWVPVF